MDTNNKQLTYVEQRGEARFDWNDFLTRVEAGTVTEREWKDAFELASSWITCACGNECAVLPRSSHGCPDDDRLYDLGCDFMDIIRDGYKENESLDITVLNGRECLRRIEARTAYLLTCPDYTAPDEDED